MHVERSFPPLSRVLTWEDHELTRRVTEGTRRSHLTFVASLATRAAASFTDGHSVLQGLASQDDVNVEQILASPETCHRLYAALGGDATAWEMFSESVESAGQAIAPVRDRPLLEFESDSARRELFASTFRPTQFSPLEPFEPSVRSRVEHLIGESFDDLTRELPLQHSYVTNLVKTIIPRQDRQLAGFKGSSNATEIGRVNLFNPQRTGLTTVPVVTSLIHEATHILLYIQEHKSPLVLDPDIALKTLIQSPWSGKKVNLRALIHATFVWYGLSFTWSTKPETSRFSSYDVKYFQEFCARGFFDNAIDGVLAPWAYAIRPDVWDELAVLSQTHASKLGRVR